MYVYESVQLCGKPMIQQDPNIQKELLKTELRKLEKESVPSVLSDYAMSDLVVLTYLGPNVFLL